MPGCHSRSCYWSAPRSPARNVFAAPEMTHWRRCSPHRRSLPLVNPDHPPARIPRRQRLTRMQPVRRSRSALLQPWSGNASVVRNNETTHSSRSRTTSISTTSCRRLRIQRSASPSAIATTFSSRRMRRSPSTPMSMRTAASKMRAYSTSPRYRRVRGGPRWQKPGDMKIRTPTATLGIRWHHRPRRSAGRRLPPTIRATFAIKLYPDADAGSAGSRSTTAPVRGLGFSRKAPGGFTIRPGVAARGLCRRAACDFAATDAARPGFGAPG